MEVISERLISVTSRYLSRLKKSGEMREWVANNKERFKETVEGFNELVDKLNNIPDDSPLLEFMPKTANLKKVLAGRTIPFVEDMMEGNYGTALINARDPMLTGQKIKNKEVESTSENKAYAIGTPSMDTKVDALSVGTAGHLMERVFFKWAESQGLRPEGGWEKDQWLQALDEGLLLELSEGKKPILTDYFIKSNAEGGLGWLNNDKLEVFINKVKKLI